MDVVVTVPKKFGLDTWIAEGDAAGQEWSGQDYYFWIGRHEPANLRSGDRVYVVYDGKLRGYAPLINVHCVEDRTGKHVGLRRRGGAVAVTIDAPIKGFRGFRYRWWDRSEEKPFPDWRNP